MGENITLEIGNQGQVKRKVKTPDPTVVIASLDEITEAIEWAWVGATAAGKWTSKCPSMNQCAVTALVVQDYFGGEMLRCETTEEGVSHYWNRLPDGREVDLTAAQFEYTGVEPHKHEYVVRTREYVLSYRKTKTRYKVLKKRVKRYLDGER